MSELRRILVPTDFSLHARGAVQYALVLADRLGAEVRVLHVCSDGEHIGRLGALHEATDLAAAELEAASREDAEQQLQAFMAEVEADTSAAVREVRFDDPFDAILRLSESFDLLVMGTHGRRGLERLVMGSLTEKVLRASSAPVVTYRWPKAAPMPRPGLPKRLLVPVDFSEASRHALQLGADLAARFEAELDVVHVVPHVTAVEGAEILVEAEGASKLPFERWTRTRATEDLEAFMSRTRALPSVTKHVELGDPGRTICRLAEEGGYDLVAMGTHGRQGVERWMMGSVAERVAREAPCPVLTTRVLAEKK